MKSALLFSMAAMAGFSLTRCGDPAPEGPCTDTSCASGEVCHPTAKVCVKTCNTGSCDQPNVCTTAPWGGTADGGALKICGCEVIGHCGSGTDVVCSTADKVCTTKCTATSCGTGRTCDMTTGQCSGGTGTCNWSSCSTSSFTAAGRTCTSSGCAAGPTCTGSGQSTCTNNNYCAAGSCGYPVYPTQAACQNFYSGGKSGPTWNPASSTGPVIYSVTEVSHGPGQFGTAACTSGSSEAGNCQCPPTETQWNIRILAYRNDMAWPATRAGLSGFKYVTTTGSEVDIVGSTLLRPQTGYENGSSATDKQFNVYHCGSNANAFQPGYYFTGGNEVCRQL